MSITKTYLDSDPETITFLIVDPVYGKVLNNKGSFIQDIDFGQDLSKYLINDDVKKIGKIVDILFEAQEFYEFPWKAIFSKELPKVQNILIPWMAMVNKQYSCKMGSNADVFAQKQNDVCIAASINFRALQAYFADKPWRHNPGPTKEAGTFVNL